MRKPFIQSVPKAEVPEDIMERLVHYKNTRGFMPNSIQTMVRQINIAGKLICLFIKALTINIGKFYQSNFLETRSKEC